MSADAMVIDEVETWALRLSPLDRVRLAERIMATVERDLLTWRELEQDAQLLAQAKAQATGFMTLDELAGEYERATGHTLGE